MVAAQAAIDDTIAINRTLPVTALGDVPQRPRAYVPTDIEVRRRVLRKMAEDLRAEGKEALAEAVAVDLGAHAPAVETAAVLLDRIRACEAVILRVNNLLEYLSEIEDIALSDAVVFLEKMNRAYKYHVEHDPGLAEKYQALARLFSARGRMVAEGRARALAVAEAESRAAGAVTQPEPADTSPA